MPQAEDAAILTRAADEDWIVITNDKDFGELVFRSGLGHRGVLLLRLHDDSSSNRVRVLRAVIEQYGERLAGSFTVATEIGVRIRPANPSAYGGQAP